MFFRRKEKIKKPLFRRLINYFIYFCVGLITLLLIALGITQTSTFRNWLKDFVVEQVNTATYGKLYLERIDGTIFTSLILKNAVYTFEEDTIFSADKIEIKTSPLKIIFKIIYFRKIEIENARIAFLKDKNGELNISKIVPPSEEEEDTTESAFNWKFEISDLSLKNINFRLQSDSLKNSKAYYEHPNMNDLRLRNLNLSLYAFADINGNEYAANIKEFNVAPNLLGFNLKNLSGNFIFIKDMAGISDFEIETDKSYLTLNAAVEEFPIFSDEEINLDYSTLKLQLSATDFNFDDLTTFIEGTEILKGSVETHIKAEGTLSELSINELQLEFGETNLDAEGQIRNTLGGTDMFINTTFTNSSVNQNDIKNLLPTIKVPLYPDYGVLSFDSLYFSGNPLNFDAGFNIGTEKGKIISRVKLDL
jgi:hypothetical protein